MPAFLNPAEAEMWVGVGLLIFLAIVIFGAKAPKKVTAALDAKAASIQADLDEAARIREEATRLLEQLKAERAQAERQAKEMLEAAHAEARRLEADAKAKLEESLTRRRALAERKIATAEAQAAAEVKAAAAELAAQATEALLVQRLAGAKSDPLVDAAIGQLATKLQ
ncbi:F0F1 ATP synthase subunit B [Phenylobacterium deserti]|uniref:ATP synthase subunit b n=1 Tax=Phenylobacterium deserti TaxID=1914756 RepID=A0A328ATA4_9CAUL|nr:F0F1 ATP synthase subunit B [Phenylobacterium deserti]RAK56734.1 ATP F0F1 synthase subunit B [Phenylobacterium deserti]